MKLNGILLLKLISIFFLGGIYLVLGVLTSKFVKKLVCTKEKYNSKLKNLISVFITAGIIMVSIYLLRQIPENIPNPLHGYYGFDSKRITELNGGVILAFAFLHYLGPCLHKKIDVIFS
jgi:hypothetical protein